MFAHEAFPAQADSSWLQPTSSMQALMLSQHCCPRHAWQLPWDARLPQSDAGSGSQRPASIDAYQMHGKPAAQSDPAAQVR
jgi:hypothetical protein